MKKQTILILAYGAVFLIFGLMFLYTVLFLITSPNDKDLLFVASLLIFLLHNYIASIIWQKISEEKIIKTPRTMIISLLIRLFYFATAFVLIVRSTSDNCLLPWALVRTIACLFLPFGQIVSDGNSRHRMISAK